MWLRPWLEWKKNWGGGAAVVVVACARARAMIGMRGGWCGGVVGGRGGVGVGGGRTGGD